MTITADYQGNLRSLTFGDGTAFDFAAAGVDGLGIAGVRSYDQDRGTRTGAVGGRDILQPRTMTLHFNVTARSPYATATAASQALKAAWAPAADDIPLDLRLPGFPETIMRFYGRPRGIQMDYSWMKRNLIRAQGFFTALDPLMYGAEVVTAVSGTANVTNAGDAATDRCIITLTGAGTVPSIINNTTGETIAFASAVSGTRTLNLRTHTVNNGGVNSDSEVDPASVWFSLNPGVNSITATNCTLSFAHRPAWF